MERDVGAAAAVAAVHRKHSTHASTGRETSTSASTNSRLVISEAMASSDDRMGRSRWKVNAGFCDVRTDRIRGGALKPVKGNGAHAMLYWMVMCGIVLDMIVVTGFCAGICSLAAVSLDFRMGKPTCRSWQPAHDPATGNKGCVC